MNVPPGPHNLSDMVVSTLMQDAGGAAAAAALGGMGAAGAGGAGMGGADFAAFGGIDPNADPELAMVLRMSMEEEQRRAAVASVASAPAETPKPAAAAPPALVDDGGLSVSDIFFLFSPRQSSNSECCIVFSPSFRCGDG